MSRTHHHKSRTPKRKNWFVRINCECGSKKGIIQFVSLAVKDVKEYYCRKCGKKQP